MKNRQFSFSTSQPLYMNPASPLSSSRPCPRLLFHRSYLREDKPQCLSASQRKKKTFKLWEVVYSVQTASSWGAGVPESLANALGDQFSEILIPTKLTSSTPLLPNTEEMNRNVQILVNICNELMYLILFSFPIISVRNSLREMVEYPGGIQRTSLRLRGKAVVSVVLYVPVSLCARKWWKGIP